MEPLFVYEEKCHMCAYVTVPGKRDCMTGYGEEGERDPGEKVTETQERG